MHIRRATAADISAILSLEQQAATAAHWQAEQYQMALSAETPARLMLLAEDESGVLGFVVGREAGGELEIENLAVTPAVQRRGLATSLLKELRRLAGRGARQSAFLEVRESNLAARRLYEKNLFVESGRRPHYYRDPEEDAIVYRLATAPLPHE